jgi:hypothetical protein
MKATPLVLGALVLSAPAFAAQSTIPEALPASRYEKLIDSSPFALATKAEAPAEKGPGPFVNLTVAAIAQIKDAQGKTQDIVTIKSRADQSTFTLIGNEPTHGYQVAGIEWSDRVGATTVTLKKGSEFGPVKFDEANLRASAQPAVAPRPMQPGGQVPGAPNSNLLQRSGARPAVVPRPTTVAPVPNQPAPAVQGTVQPNANPQLPGNTGTDRPRRVRVINSKP